eukprot:COSAG01_NODE_67126_length_268_cov_0.597633_1_plen_89_part_11
MINPLEAHLLWSRVKHGNDALHGPHHDAQKSISTTLPFVGGTATPGSNIDSLGNVWPIDGGFALALTSDANITRIVKKNLFAINPVMVL